jgi:hypothetical protein
MGIKGYLKYMVQEEPFKKDRKYDYVYIDCNYMLHYLIYNCKNDFDLYSKLYEYIKYLFENIVITKKIFLIFDGKHPVHLHVANPKLKTIIQRAKYKKESTDYDKQKIAPKTPIIKTFKDNLVDIINIYKKIYKGQFSIEINDDYNDDEADFKILNSIYDNPYDNVCIISKDSDMILIAYSLMCKKNINIDILSNLRPIKFIDINKINKGYNRDYILIILLMGNDYLPKLSNIDYESLINNYDQYLYHQNPHIITNNIVNYDNLINFLTYIIVNKKIKININNLNIDRFKKYYNNILWCLKKYKVIDNNYEYVEDENNNKVINIYNFINSSDIT